MKVLITGATGFIGSNLVREFLALGDEVHVLTRKTSDRWRIDDVLSEICDHHADLLDYSALEKTVQGIRPNVILHSAVYGGFPSQDDAWKILDTNYKGTVNLVKACSKLEYDAFINTGSSSEYGLKQKPMREKDLLEPVGDYGVSKAAASLYCRSEAIKNDKPITTLRLFSPYGPFEESKRLMPSVIQSCLSGENPTLSCPAYVRDFIYAEDVLAAYRSAITFPATGEIINIGSGKQHTVGEAVDTIIKITKARVTPQWGSAEGRPNEPKTWQADVSKARDLLKWKPKYSLKEGLEKTVEWFKKEQDTEHCRLGEHGEKRLQ